MFSITTSAVQVQLTKCCKITKIPKNNSFPQIRNKTRCTVSSLFQPLYVLPKGSVKKEESVAKSQMLMVDNGLIRPCSPGMYHLLPLAVRAVQKLTNMIDHEMEMIGAQKLLLPTLTEGKVWQLTGRWDSIGPELYTLHDRHDTDYVLSPTHEEAVTGLVASIFQLSYQQLPLRLYQISSKFRDEMKPRFGLLRCKEFIMKDLYTFDVSKETAEESYRVVCEAYKNFFHRLGVPFVKVTGDTGLIGGSLSHEFHLPATIGEDKLLQCSRCGYGINILLFHGERECPNCKGPLDLSNGIEVGHTFLLGTKYSEVLKAMYYSDKGKAEVTVMGCYGIGVTRLLAGVIEVLSTEEEIRWPLSIAPYKVCIIPPKEGSKEEAAIVMAQSFYDDLTNMQGFSNDVILDDRTQLTIGKRILQAKRTGYPYILVMGRKAVETDSVIELHDVNNGIEHLLSPSDVMQYLKAIK